MIFTLLYYFNTHKDWFLISVIIWTWNSRKIDQGWKYVTEYGSSRKAVYILWDLDLVLGRPSHKPSICRFLCIVFILDKPFLYFQSWNKKHYSKRKILYWKKTTKIYYDTEKIQNIDTFYTYIKLIRKFC